jgi:hypothetical protein
MFPSERKPLAHADTVTSTKFPSGQAFLLENNDLCTPRRFIESADPVE